MMSVSGLQIRPFGGGKPSDVEDDDIVQYRLEGDVVLRQSYARDLAWDGADGFGVVCEYAVLARRGAPVMAVGDVNGTEKGSGARANGGKPAVELIPANVIGAYYERLSAHPPRAESWGPSVVGALQSLGEFQMRARVELEPLLDVLFALDHDGKLLEETARVFDYGRKKYTAWNWARGMAWSIPIGCAIRHLMEMRLNPAAVDPESGEPHRGHVGCNIVMLLWFLGYYPEGDDRPRLP